MKTWLAFLLLSLGLSSKALSASYQKLTELNPEWRLHVHIANILTDAVPTRDEHAWISLHLQLVEQQLRSAGTLKWNGKQLSNRLRCLDLLHAYRQAGRFPVNEAYTTRTPIFIDRHDNFCAVGFLIRETGYEAYAREVAAANNLIRIRDLDGPTLQAWAAEFGFTIDELAWIQPSYTPEGRIFPIGKGVNGSVRELYADDSSDRLYVGGIFSKVDDSMSARNIAYLTEAGGTYTWHSMSVRLQSVNAITKFEGSIHAAGADGVVRLEGNRWSDVGCFNYWGKDVYDIQVLNGTLYACGWMRGCEQFAPFFNFARWNGDGWEPIDGVKGVINTMFVQDTSLILGGNLVYNNTQLNVVSWSPKAGFRAYANGIPNEVMDFCRFHDTLFAACRRTSSIDSTSLIARLEGDRWVVPKLTVIMKSFYPFSSKVSFNTLCADGNQLMTGGSFWYEGHGQFMGRNMISLINHFGEGKSWTYLDSPMNKMVVFKKDLIVAGAFRYGGSSYTQITELNGIGRRPAIFLSAGQPGHSGKFEVYPNPAQSGGTITIRSPFNAGSFAIYGFDGRVVSAGLINSRQAVVKLPVIPPGLYLLALSGKDGSRAGCRLLIE